MAERPNLLLFMPETLRADAVFGPPADRARTPNLDRLAGEGVSFTNAFAQMSYCTPSRCSMFTGLYPHTSGHRSIWRLLQSHERDFFQDLKEAGYTNVVYGKNDLVDRSVAAQRFDETDARVKPKGSEEGQPIEPGSRLEYAMYRGLRVGDCRDADWADTQSALSFLDEDHDGPWCVFLPLRFAHPPYRVEEPFFSMHDRDQVPPPIPAELDGKRAFMRALHEVYGGDRLDEPSLREIKATYFGMVSRVDSLLGPILDKLCERGMESDTVVAAFSDHGDYAGDFGMVEKYMAGFEDCLLNVPLIIRAPGCNAGVRDALCEMTDLYPTLLGLLGVESKHYHFGRSLVPLMEGETTEHRDAVFAEGGRLDDEDSFIIKRLLDAPDTFYGRRVAMHKDQPGAVHKAAMVRAARYKYTYAPADRDELYDMRSDPRELRNLAESPDHQAVLAEMRGRLMRWMLDTSDTLPLEQGSRGWR